MGNKHQIDISPIQTQLFECLQQVGQRLVGAGVDQRQPEVAFDHVNGSVAVTKIPRVDIIFACADMSPDLIDSAVTNGAKGIVIAGVGNGNMNKTSLEAAARAAKKGVIVVRSSRVATGTVGRNVEVNDDELGFIASDELNPQKARILLSLALLKTRTKDNLQSLFTTY